MARLYPLLLGSRCDELAPLLREVHECARLLRGTVTVTLGANPLSRMLARLAGMPASCSDAPCEVRFEHPPGSADGAERWLRDMAGSRFSSLLVSVAPAEFRESFGWYRFRFALLIDNGAVEFALRGWSVLGVPMPRVWWPRISTRESQQGNEYLFAVRVELPLLGLLVDYRGRLRVAESAA